MHDPIEGQYLRELDPAIYLTLEDHLDENSAWRQLFYVMPARFTRGLLEIIERDRLKPGLSPARILLQRLDSRNVRTSTFVKWLEAANLIKPLLLLKTDEPLEIIQQPSPTVLVNDGATLRLSCLATAFPPPEYQWFKGDEELLLHQDKDLVINSARSAHSGYYICRIHTFHSRGPSVLFTRPCHVTVMPPFEVKMDPLKKTFVQLSSGESGSSQLAIMPLSPKIANTDSQKTDLEEGTVTIANHPVSPGRIRQGSSVVLTCVADSIYPVQYQWYCDGRPIQGKTDSMLKLESIFPDPQTKATKWQYQCKAFNQFDHVFSNSATVELLPSDENTNFIADEKIALLIANEFCDKSNPLSLTSNDVFTMTRLLMSLGFRVVALRNLNHTEMLNAVEVFCRTLGPNSYGLFYFAGHGMQVRGQTYLLPTDCPLDFTGLEVEAISEMTICADCVLDRMQSQQPAYIIQMFDMCRDTPVGAEAWIPPRCCQAETKGNTVRCYATSSFSSAYEVRGDENGFFVKHLKEFLTKPRTKLQDIIHEVQVAFQHDDAVRGLQYPTIESTLSEFRTLGDEVRVKSNSAFDQTLSWASPEAFLFDSMPFDVTLDDSTSSAILTVVLKFCHHREIFCNAMDTYVYIDIPEDVPLEEVYEVDISVEFIDQEYVVKPFGSEYKPGCICVHSLIELMDIQRVMGEINGKLTAKSKRTGDIFLEETFCLGKHPVLQLNHMDL